MQRRCFAADTYIMWGNAYTPKLLHKHGPNHIHGFPALNMNIVILNTAIIRYGAICVG